jgi:hypothetical protein
MHVSRIDLDAELGKMPDHRDIASHAVCDQANLSQN